MTTDRTQQYRRTARTARFEWSAWLAAAFVLLVVAPALQAQQQQALLPLYSTLLPGQPQAQGPADDHARSVETALAVLRAVGQTPGIAQPMGAGQIQAPQLVSEDGTARAAVTRTNFYRSHALQPLAHAAPHLAPSRVFTAHVVLGTALTAGEAPHRAGARSNRSHE